MEIDIPDLDDLKFEDYCRHSNYFDQIFYKQADCPYCEGTGYKVTVVGERLLEFLRKRGINISENRTIKDESEGI